MNGVWFYHEGLARWRWSVRWVMGAGGMLVSDVDGLTADLRRFGFLRVVVGMQGEEPR